MTTVSLSTIKLEVVKSSMAINFDLVKDDTRDGGYEDEEDLLSTLYVDEENLLSTYYLDDINLDYVDVPLDYLAHIDTFFSE